MLLNVLNVLQVQERDHLANIMQTQKTVCTVSVNIMKKIEITKDDHFSQTYEQTF